jgi:hypothetical protein
LDTGGIQAVVWTPRPVPGFHEHVLTKEWVHMDRSCESRCEQDGVHVDTQKKKSEMYFLEWRGGLFSMFGT